MTDREEVLARLAHAAVDMWLVARESNAEQVDVIEAVQDGKAVPRIVLQLGPVLQVAVDVLSDYGETGIVRMLYTETPIDSAVN